MQEDLYTLVDSMLGVSFLVEDLTLLNHWEKVIGVGKLKDPDFLKTLPRTSSEILAWIKSNEVLLKQVYDDMNKNNKMQNRIKKFITTKTRGLRNSAPSPPSMATQILDILQLASKKDTKEEILKEMELLKDVHYYPSNDDISGDNDDDNNGDENDDDDETTTTAEEESEEELKERETITQRSLSKILERANKKDTKEGIFQEIHMLRTICELRTMRNDDFSTPRVNPKELLSILQRASQQETTDKIMTVMAELAPNTKKFDPYFHLSALEDQVKRDKEHHYYQEQKRKEMAARLAQSNDDTNDKSRDILLGSVRTRDMLEINTLQLEDEDESSMLFVDDMYAYEDIESEAVWGIIKNPYLKRITVVFRGSKTKKDWLQDCKFFEKNVTLDMIIENSKGTPTCSPLSSSAKQSADTERKEEEENIGEGFFDDFHEFTIHQGFYEYLFEPQNNKFSHNNDSTNSSSASNGEGEEEGRKATTKFQEILHRVNVIMRDSPDYSLFFTGHSLGAALATVTATAMAIGNVVQVRPIRLITFASPHVGKSSFADMFKKLELANRIQHLRVTNSDDLVPVLLGSLGFIHTGCHLNFREARIMGWLGDPNDSSMLYDLDRSSNTVVGRLFTNKMSPDIPKWATGNPSHHLIVYKKRLDRIKEILEKETFDDICIDLTRKEQEQREEQKKKIKDVADAVVAFTANDKHLSELSESISSKISDHIEKKDEFSIASVVVGVLAAFFLLWKTWNWLCTIQEGDPGAVHEEL